MNPAKIIGSAPFFFVKDLDCALDYYCDVLGFSRPPLWGDPPEFAMPSRDNFTVMLLAEPETEGEVTSNGRQSGNWDAYFWITDAESLFDEFKAAGAIIDHEPVVRSYEIKEFAIQDPDGHLLAFGQHWSA